MDNFDPRGMVGKIYVRDHLTLLYTKYISYGPHEEKIFKSCSHYKSMRAIILFPRSMASLHPRGLIGRIYVGDHWILLHTKYISCGPSNFREYFLCLSCHKSIRDIDPQRMASFDPGS